MIIKGPMIYVALLVVLAASGAIIFGLTKLPTYTRRPLLVAIVFVSGLFYALEYFLPVAPIKEGGKPVNFLTPLIPDIVTPLSQILEALLLGLGLYSLGRVHSIAVIRKREGWVNSAALLISAVAMLVIGLVAKSIPEDKYTESTMPVVVQLYSHLFDGLYQNMDAAMFSVISFYILSAAYRAFRIRSVEGSILMVAALVVLLGLSFGTLITNSIPTEGIVANLRIDTLSSWVLGVLSLPALRAINFGVGLGLLAMGLRIWLGIERGAIFGD